MKQIFLTQRLIRTPSLLMRIPQWAQAMTRIIMMTMAIRTMMTMMSITIIIRTMMTMMNTMLRITITKMIMIGMMTMIQIGDGIISITGSLMNIIGAPMSTTGAHVHIPVIRIMTIQRIKIMTKMRTMMIMTILTGVDIISTIGILTNTIGAVMSTIGARMSTIGRIRVVEKMMK